MKILFRIIAVICLLTPSFLSAQNAEVIIPSNARFYKIYEAGDNGILVSYEFTEGKSGKQAMKFEVYDTSFHSMDSKTFIMPALLTSKDEYYNELNKTIYYLFYEFGNMDTWRNTFKLVSYNCISHSLSILDGKFPRGFWVGSLYVVKNTILIKESFKKWNKLNIEDGTITDFDMGDYNESLPSDISQSELFQTTSFVFNTKSASGTFGYKTRNFGEGKERKFTTINSGNSNNLSSLSIVKTGNDEKFAAGTYTNELSKKDEENFRSRHSVRDAYFISEEGFYISKFQNNEQEYIKFIPLPRLRTKINNEAKRNLGDMVTITSAEIMQPVKINTTFVVVANIYNLKYEFAKEISTIDMKTNRISFQFNLKSKNLEYSLIYAFNEDGDQLWRDSVNLSNKANSQVGKQVTSLEYLKSNNTCSFYYFKDGSLKGKAISEKGISDMNLKESKILSEVLVDDSNKIIMAKHMYGRSCVYRVVENNTEKLLFEQY